MMYLSSIIGPLIDTEVEARHARKVLVLGGGVLQVSAWFALKALGYEGMYVIGFDGEALENLDGGKARIRANPYNADAVLRGMEKAGFIPDFVYPASMEATETAALINEMLEFKGYPKLELVRRTRDKLLFRKMTGRVRFMEATAKDAEAVVKEFPDGVVIKPRKGSGSLGVSIVEHPDVERVKAAIARALEANPEFESVLAEEYVAGPQVSSEVIVEYPSGTMTLVSATRRFFLADRPWIEAGHRQDSVPKELSFSLLVESVRLLADLGYHSMPPDVLVFKVDWVISGRGPVPLEATFRLSGGLDSGLTQQISSGRWLDLALLAAMGGESWERYTIPTRSIDSSCWWVSRDMRVREKGRILAEATRIGCEINGCEQDGPFSVVVLGPNKADPRDCRDRGLFVVSWGEKHEATARTVMEKLGGKAYDVF